MKTRSILFVFGLMAMSALSLFSCSTDENSDVTKPVISLIEPAEDAELRIGSSNGVHLEMDLSDDVKLGSYKIDIHSNFDHHSHGQTRSEDATVPFTFSRSYEIVNAKNHHVHHHDIVIPANATPGDYHLMIYCTDAAGNESYVARDIVLSLTAAEDVD